MLDSGFDRVRRGAHCPAQSHTVHIVQELAGIVNLADYRNPKFFSPIKELGDVWEENYFGGNVYSDKSD